MSGPHLKYHDASPFSNHEAVSIITKRPRSSLWIFVRTGGQGLQAFKSSIGQRMDARLGRASDHDVCFASSDKTSGVSNGMSTSRAGRIRGKVRALMNVRAPSTRSRVKARYLKAILHGNVTGCKVVQEPWDKPGRDLAGALFCKKKGVVIDVLEAAYAGAERDSLHQRLSSDFDREIEALTVFSLLLPVVDLPFESERGFHPACSRASSAAAKANCMWRDVRRSS